MNNDFKKILNKEAKNAYAKSRKEITKGNNVVLLLVILLISLVVIAKTSEPERGNVILEGKDISSLVNKKEIAYVKNVVDGDTIEVFFETGILSEEKNKIYKLRFIGMDTPESKHRDEMKNTKEGQIAYQYTKEKLENQKITVEFDISPVDKFGRLLGYIWLDDEMFNKHLLDIGYAKLMTVSPNVKYTNIFKEAQNKAKLKNIGFWNTDVFIPKPKVNKMIK